MTQPNEQAIDEVPLWIKRYHSEPNYRAAQVRWHKHKMDTDPEFRARANQHYRDYRARMKKKRATDPQYLAHIQHVRREAYLRKKARDAVVAAAVSITEQGVVGNHAPNEPE